MKLLFAFVQNDDVKPLTRALIKRDIRVTRVSSSGGFLKSGNSTLMIGVESEQLQEVLDTIEKHSQRRTIAMPAPVMASGQAVDSTLLPINVTVGGATVFVIEAESHHQF